MRVDPRGADEQCDHDLQLVVHAINDAMRRAVDLNTR